MIIDERELCRNWELLHNILHRLLLYKEIIFIFIETDIIYKYIYII